MHNGRRPLYAVSLLSIVSRGAYLYDRTSNQIGTGKSKCYENSLLDGSRSCASFRHDCLLVAVPAMRQSRVMPSSRCSSSLSSLSRSQCSCSDRCVAGDGRMLTPRIHPSDRFCLWSPLPVWLLRLVGYILRTRIRSSSRACSSLRRFFLFSALLTHWVKLSLHVAFTALTATTLSLLGSWVGYALIAVVPLVFWSRIALTSPRSRADRWAGARRPHRSCACPALTELLAGMNCSGRPAALKDCGSRR